MKGLWSDLWGLVKIVLLLTLGLPFLWLLFPLLLWWDSVQQTNIEGGDGDGYGGNPTPTGGARP